MLQLTSGDYIYSTAADDQVLPGFFEKSINLLTQYPQAGLCCSDPAFFDGQTGAVRRNRLHLSDEPRYFSPDELVKLMRLEPIQIAGHTSLMKRTFLLEAGGWLPQLRWHCDWFALLVVAFRHGLCYIPEPLAMLRALPSTYSASGMREWPAQRDVLRHLLNLLKSPEYRDVLPLFKRSGVLSVFGWPILRVILNDKNHRDFLSIRLIRDGLWSGILRMLAPLTPDPIRRLHRLVHDRQREIY
jgi:hypothetical protein